MIDPKEILRRRDMRDVFTFTIDPSDAKDFDDALSFVENPDATFQIGVHIADVSFYVKPGSKIDEDAYQRGTSVYLVDKVLPMLPEELCNDLCSLRPDEDKLCMSVIFTMDANAKVLKHKICRTIIRSNARLDYEQAQCIIDSPNQTNETLTRDYRLETKAGGKADFDPILVRAITILNQLAVKLRADRIAKGALTIEQEEMRFKLDKHNHPTEIYFEHPNESHHLIEEFMLLANRTVASSVGGRPFVYRVHDKPDEEKLGEIKAYPHTSLEGEAAQEAYQRLIDMLTIRAQAKAVYSTHNIGHYGLAFTHYTHFTSPIRRYPDLMVHRLIDKYILSGKPATWTQEQLEEICEHCSACEQEAQQAERDSIKQFQTMWMQDHIGEVLPGHISGVTEFGLFVQLDESHCEGLVHISTIGQGEYWQYDEKNYRLVAEKQDTSTRKGKKKAAKNARQTETRSYTLGEAVMVKVVRADVNLSQIDFELVEN